MDEAREMLMAERRGPSVSSFLNWLSTEAFGSGASGAASAYRSLLDTPWVRALKSQVHTRPGYAPLPSQDSLPLDTCASSAQLDQDKGRTSNVPTAELRAKHARATPACATAPVPPTTDNARSARSWVPPTAAQLAGLEQIASLALTDLVSLRKAAQGYPPLLQMSPDAVVERLLRLKSILPGSDVSFLCAKQPQLFYGTAEAELPRISARYQELHAGLPGIDVDEVIANDPMLLFIDVTAALASLGELWSLEAAVLRNSEPKEVALAVRAVSPSGPPLRF